MSLTACTSSQYYLNHDKINLRDDQKISSLHVWFDTGKYKRNLATIDTVLESRNYLYRFKVIDNEVSRFPENINDGVGLGTPNVICKVEILDDYGADTGLVGKMVEIMVLTHPQIQIYRSPRLVVGSEYIMISQGSETLINVKATGGGFYFRIDNIDGVEYIYPYTVDCSTLKNNIQITDAAEASIYKDYSDWDVLAYLKEHDIEKPVFYFKFELNDFVTQITAKQVNKRS